LGSRVVKEAIPAMGLMVVAFLLSYALNVNVSSSCLGRRCWAWEGAVDL
jgi:hypothetical protein